PAGWASRRSWGSALAVGGARTVGGGGLAGIPAAQPISAPADDLTDPAVAQTFLHLDSSILLSRERAAHGLYPAVDPLASTSRLLDPAYIGERHYQVAMRVKQTFERYRQVRDMVTMLGLEELQPEDQQAVRRARALARSPTHS